MSKKILNDLVTIVVTAVVTLALVGGLAVVYHHASADVVIEEDQPGWDCLTMGNQVCGQSPFAVDELIGRVAR